MRGVTAAALDQGPTASCPCRHECGRTIFGMVSGMVGGGACRTCGCDVDGALPPLVLGIGSSVCLWGET